MRTKFLFIIAGVLLALIFLTGACSTGFVLGRILATPTPSQAFAAPTQAVIPQNGNTESEPQAPTETAPEDSTGPLAGPNPNQTAPEDLEDLFDPFWDAWDIVHAQFVDQPVDDVALMRGAIQGMLEALGDEHTSYMDPDQFMQANIPLEQEYEGIGAWVDTNTEFLTIISPMPDSPAEAAGLQTGDEVIAIDGEDMTGIDGNLVVRKVLGPAGSKVTLTIRRQVEGAEPEIFDVEVTRAKIVIHSVTGEMLDDGIGYVSINSFADNTRDELRDVLEELLAQNPKGLVVDLRNNGGGFLNTAIEVTSEFVGDGVIMYEDYGDGSRDTYEAIPGGLATEIPLVVLINQGSASASEIMAGAIQDRDRGVLVGETSFGKGSVQNWVPLNNGQDGAVRVTIARWLTPDERHIHQVGLTPDIEVPLTEEDFTAGEDPQLDRAVEFLLTGQ